MQSFIFRQIATGNFLSLILLIDFAKLLLASLTCFASLSLWVGQTSLLPD